MIKLKLLITICIYKSLLNIKNTHKKKKTTNKQHYNLIKIPYNKINNNFINNKILA